MLANCRNENGTYGELDAEGNFTDDLDYLEFCTFMTESDYARKDYYKQIEEIKAERGITD